MGLGGANTMSFSLMREQERLFAAGHVCQQPLAVTSKPQMESERPPREPSLRACLRSSGVGLEICARSRTRAPGGAPRPMEEEEQVRYSCHRAKFKPVPTANCGNNMVEIQRGFWNSKGWAPSKRGFKSLLISRRFPGLFVLGACAA